MRARPTACIALTLLAMSVGVFLSAADPKAGPPALSEEGQKLEAQYAGELKALQAEIKAALAKFDAQKKADYQKARDAQKAAKAELGAANKMSGGVKRAQGLVAHARGKWIGGANRAVANAKKKLAAAKTDAQRSAAQKELAKAEKGLAAGQKALAERLAQLEKAKAEEGEAPKRVAAAKEGLTAARARTRQVLEETGLSAFLEQGALDAKLAKFVVLREATPRGLALFAQKGPEQAGLIQQLLTDTKLMVQMLVADGAKRPRGGAGPVWPCHEDLHRHPEGE